MYHNWDVSVEVTRQRMEEELRWATDERFARAAERGAKEMKRAEQLKAAALRPARVSPRRLLVSMVATTARFMSLLF